MAKNEQPPEPRYYPEGKTSPIVTHENGLQGNARVCGICRRAMRLDDPEGLCLRLTSDDVINLPGVGPGVKHCCMECFNEQRVKIQARMSEPNRFIELVYR